MDETTKLQIEANDRTIAANEKEIEKNEKRMEMLRDAMLEDNKLTFEAMKHLTTLSAGSILLLVTFLEKLFSNQREWSGLIIAALLCFIVSIITAMSSLLQTASLMTTVAVVHKDMKLKEQSRSATVVITFVVFVLGMIALSVFTIKNLY